MEEFTAYRVQVFALSAYDLGPIDWALSVEVLVQAGESVEAVLDRAIEELSSLEGGVSSYHFTRYPRALTRAIADEVSQFDDGGEAAGVYSVTQNGVLGFHRDMACLPWDDLRRALAADPTAVRSDAVVISRDGGTGGVNAIIFGARMSGRAGAAGTAVGNSIWGCSLPRDSPRGRRIVKQWVERGLDQPDVIDEWFSKRSCWDAEHVSQLLRVTRVQAEWVLHNFGYRCLDGGMWVRSYAREAQGSRRRWKLPTDRNASG